MADFRKLRAFARNGVVHVVVEASRGMTVKCKYDPERGLFVLGKPLPHGLVYPFDWGFIPGTCGDDGDPLDALVLHDGACPVGCLIECEIAGVLQIEEQEKAEKPKRNDRFMLIPQSDLSVRKSVLNTRLKRELEQFFQSVVLSSGKKLTFAGWKDPNAAHRTIRQAVTGGAT